MSFFKNEENIGKKWAKMFVKMGSDGHNFDKKFGKNTRKIG